jgi:hypothetical protein
MRRKHWNEIEGKFRNQFYDEKQNNVY